MGSPGRHAARPITPRSAIATVLAVLVVFALGVLVAVPAHQASVERQNAIAQSQDLASKVLEVCHQGGETAAPLISIGACPLAQQVQSTPLAAAPISTPLTAQQVDSMIRAEIARSLPKVAVPVEGGAPASSGPAIAPGVAGQPDKGVDAGPAAPDNRYIQQQPPSTRDERPPLPSERQAPYRYPAPPYRYQRPRQATMTQPYPYQQPPYQRQVTVTEQAPPPPVTVTQQPPVTQTVTQPAPVTQTVEQPVQAAQPVAPAAPANQGTPLLNGVGGLLNGLGNGQ